MTLLQPRNEDNSLTTYNPVGVVDRSARYGEPTCVQPEFWKADEYVRPAIEIGERKLIIGICGFKGHGKDTAAMVLQQRFKFARLAFADGVKKLVAEALHIPLWYLHDSVKKEELHIPSGKTYRQWMQLMGTEVGRNIWGDTWTNWWKDEIAARNDLNRVVVTDMRFFNEFDMIREGAWDAMTIRIRNPHKFNNDDVHESERYALMMPVDVEINNDGTIPELWEKTEAAVLKHFPRLWVQ